MKNMRHALLFGYFCFVITVGCINAAELKQSSVVEQLKSSTNKSKVDKRTKMLCKVLRTSQLDLRGRKLRAFKSIKEALLIAKSIPQPIIDSIFTHAYKYALADMGIAFSSYENGQKKEIVVYENNPSGKIIDPLGVAGFYLRAHRLKNCTSKKNDDGLHILNTRLSWNSLGGAVGYFMHEPSGNPELIISIQCNVPPFGDIITIFLAKQTTWETLPRHDYIGRYDFTGHAQDISDGHTIHIPTVDQQITIPKIAFLSHASRDNTKVTSSILRIWQSGQKMNRFVLPGRFTKVVHLPTLTRTLLGLHENGDLSIIGLKRKDPTYNDPDIQLFKQKLSFLNTAPTSNKKIVDITVNPQVPALVALLVATSDDYRTSCQSTFELYTALFACRGNKKVYVRKIAEFSNDYISTILTPIGACVNTIDTELFFRDAVLNIRNKINGHHVGVGSVIAHTSRFLYCPQIFDDKNMRTVEKN